MARHPQPNNIKALKGESRAERFAPDGVETEKLMELPQPPQWWSVEVVKIYETEGAKLLAHKMLTVLDIRYFGFYCLLAEKMDRIWKSGETPAMSMYTQLNSFAAQMGLNPISREKMKAPTADKKQNKYAKGKPKK